MNDAIRRLSAESDARLRPFIEAGTATERDQALETLVTTAVRPIVSRVISRRRSAIALLGSGADEDVASTVLLRLLRRLQGLPLFEEDAIAGLDDYVATLTYNTIYDFLRQRFPQRTRLRNRLRYVLERDARFSIRTVDGEMICGLRSWGEQPVRDERPMPSGPQLPPSAFDRSRPGDGLEAILASLGKPTAFEALQRSVADLWNISDRESADALPFLFDRRPSAYEELEARDYLAAVWGEIVTLPENQRRAIILNLRDADGLNAAAQFLLLGIATFDELAQAVGLTPEALEAIWNDLPLADLAIGAMLGLSRQQIIDLRQSGRRRLSRRLREQHDGADSQKSRKRASRDE